MDELATSISNGVAGLKDLGSYSGFLNSSNLVSNTLSKVVIVSDTLTKTALYTV